MVEGLLTFSNPVSFFTGEKSKTQREVVAWLRPPETWPFSPALAGCPEAMPC